MPESKQPSMTLKAMIDRIPRTRTFETLVFIMIMTGAALLYNYHEILTYRPTSIHQWRNSVSASMAWNYAHEGDFLLPRTHNLQADDLTSDVSVTEFPVFYYLIGMLYRIFGTHEIIYRLVQLIIGFTGLFFLYRLGLLIFRNILYAMIPPLIVFTSPIYVYYINNFIPDAPSLSIVFIAFFFFYRFYLQGNNRDFLISMLFFALAGLIKTPAFLLYFAIAGVFLLEKLFRTGFKNDGTLFNNWKRQSAAMAVVLLAAVGWYAYAKIYTDLHGGTVSNVEIRPIWILSGETIRATWEAVRERFYYGNYHSPWLLGLTAVLLLHNLFRWKQYNRLLSWLSVLVLLGGISFSLLFYRSLRNHDYYQMNNLLILVLVSMNFLLWVKNNKARIYRSVLFKSALAGLILFLFISCEKIMKEYYYGGWYMNYARETYNEKYDNITPYLRSLGIDRQDPVYCTPDISINISLYLMDQKGHTDFFRKNVPFGEKLELFSASGAKYVILGDTTAMPGEPGDYGLTKIGERNGVRIFRIGEKAAAVGGELIPE
jgi:hypothetical protein